MYILQRDIYQSLWVSGKAMYGLRLEREQEETVKGTGRGHARGCGNETTKYGEVGQSWIKMLRDLTHRRVQGGRQKPVQDSEYCVKTFFFMWLAASSSLTLYICLASPLVYSNCSLENCHHVLDSYPQVRDQTGVYNRSQRSQGHPEILSVL